MGKAKAEKTSKLRCKDGRSRSSVKVEESAYSEKITRALTSCQAYLEKSIAAAKGVSEEYDISVWHAAAELEYALFLFSLKNANSDVTPKWKTESTDRSDPPAKLLQKAQVLVAKSRTSGISGKWLEAYKGAFAARHILLRIQRESAKKKRDLLKRSNSYSSSS